MIDFTKKYERGVWQSFLEDSFLPDDFKSDEKEISFSETLVHTQSVTKLGESACLGLTVFEITHKSTNDARVGLSKEAFRLVCNYTLHSRALVLFVPQNADDFYRFSLVEFTPIIRDDGKVMRDYSNPRRYSFLLGRDAKVKTPQQYLVQKGRVKDTDDLRMRFSVEVLNREFYALLVAWYDKALDDIQLDLAQASKILGKKIDDELKPQAVIRVIIRLLFMWFMKEKGLIDKSFFTQEFKTEYLKNENTYYNAVLQNLFFAVLNKKIGERRFRKKDTSNRYDPQKNDYGICDVFRFKDFFKDGKADSFLELTRKIPFVNGGLFTCHDYKFSGIDTATNKRNVEQNYIIDGFSDNPKDRAKISDKVIFELIELFTTYAFTIEENTPSDVVVALDPELLGTVFENLIGTYNPETKESARKATGSFYTPREIVDYMCKESLKVALASKLPHLREQIADIIESSEDHFDFPCRNDLVAAITSLKILDPACGSGAFPMGMFTLMVKTVEKLQERKTTYKNKLDIITNCIYGVDIQNIAIEISKLRFFISLLVDYEVPAKIEDFEVLPNLETKFTAANTLIGIKLSGGDLFNDQLLEHCKELTNIFTPFTKARTPKEKETIKNAFAAKKQELVKLLVDNNMAGSEVEKVSAWNPFNVCYTSPFFDSAIMFGVADGFDVVVGNPPYVSTRSNFDISIKEYYKSNYELAVGQFDLYVLFIEKANTLLNHCGVLSFITPKKLLTNENFKDARTFFLKYFPMKSYLDAQMPFESAAVEANVFVATRKFTSSTKTYRFNGNSIAHKFNVDNKLIARMPFNIFPFTMDPDNISIIDSVTKNVEHTLGEYLIITRGFEFGFNHPSVSHEKGKYKIIKGEHISKYVIKETDWYVRPDFSNKKVFKKKEVFLSTPKLVTKFVSNTLDFAFDEKGYCNTNVVYNASPTIGNEAYLKFLLALCNSTLINFWFFNTYANDDNLFPHIQKNQLESIPVIIPNNICLYDGIVDQILAAKDADPQADTRGLERQIDEMVYLLYGLTEEEVQVVEGKE